MANFSLPDFRFELDSIVVRTDALTSTFVGKGALASAVNHLKHNCGVLTWGTAHDMRMALEYRLKYGSWTERGLNFCLGNSGTTHVEFVEA